MALCACYELMRDLSRNGFTVSCRPGARAADPRLLGGPLFVTCVRCGDAYGIAPTRAKSRDELDAVQAVLAGVA